MMKRKGFTLTEVLVTLAIVSVVAAVVVPALNSQLFKGDVGRATSDLNAIKTGIQSFVADVRRYPARISDLTSLISSTAADLEGVSYTSSNISAWNGPYLDRDLVATGQTGFGGTLSNTFSQVSGGSNLYLAITINGLTSGNFAKLDEVIDQGTGTGSSTGTLQYTQNPSGTVFVQYLAVPVQ